MTPMCSVNAMPVWSMAKPCHTRLAPSPGSAKALVRRIGTVLAWVSPAGLTTVPMTASTPSASSWAIAASASGVVVICREAQFACWLPGSVVHTRLGRVSLQDWAMSRVRSTLPIPSHSAHDNAKSASSSSEKCSLQRVQKSSSRRSTVCSVANR
jgi:hypothetical protein